MGPSENSIEDEDGVKNISKSRHYIAIFVIVVFLIFVIFYSHHQSLPKFKTDKKEETESRADRLQPLSTQSTQDSRNEHRDIFIASLLAIVSFILGAVVKKIFF